MRAILLLPCLFLDELKGSTTSKNLSERAGLTATQVYLGYSTETYHLGGNSGKQTPMSLVPLLLVVFLCGYCISSFARFCVAPSGVCIGLSDVHT